MAKHDDIIDGDDETDENIDDDDIKDEGKIVYDGHNNDIGSGTIEGWKYDENDLIDRFKNLDQ